MSALPALAAAMRGVKPARHGVAQHSAADAKACDAATATVTAASTCHFMARSSSWRQHWQRAECRRQAASPSGVPIGCSQAVLASCMVVMTRLNWCILRLASCSYFALTRARMRVDVQACAHGQVECCRDGQRHRAGDDLVHRLVNLRRQDAMHMGAPDRQQDMVGHKSQHSTAPHASVMGPPALKLQLGSSSGCICCCRAHVTARGTRGQHTHEDAPHGRPLGRSLDCINGCTADHMR